MCTPPGGPNVSAAHRRRVLELRVRTPGLTTSIGLKLLNTQIGGVVRAVWAKYKKQPVA